MIRVIFASQDGQRHEVSALPGQSIMAVAVANGVPGIDGDCGGAMACGTCHVRVAPAWCELVGQASEYEECLLGVALNPGPDSRLGCQIVLTEAMDGLMVHTPASQRA